MTTTKTTKDGLNEVLREETRKKELYYLKVDLDEPDYIEAFMKIYERIEFIHRLGFFRIYNIEKIYLIKKSSYSVKILLKEPLKDVRTQIILQLILGSDYRKEVHSLVNYYYYNMSYYNRMFDIKRYKDGTKKIAEKKDITQLVFDKIRQKYLKNKKQSMKNES